MHVKYHVSVSLAYSLYGDIVFVKPLCEVKWRLNGLGQENAGKNQHSFFLCIV